MSESKDSNIKGTGINHQGNKWTSFPDGQYLYENFDSNGIMISVFHHGGPSGIIHFHDLRNPEASWYANTNTGETNRPQPGSKDNEK